MPSIYMLNGAAQPPFVSPGKNSRSLRSEPHSSRSWLEWGSSPPSAVLQLIQVKGNLCFPLTCTYHGSPGFRLSIAASSTARPPGSGARRAIDLPSRRFHGHPPTAPSHMVRKARNDHASKGESCGQSSTNGGGYVSCRRTARTGWPPIERRHCDRGCSLVFLRRPYRASDLPVEG
jgi:hypothetical protein